MDDPWGGVALALKKKIIEMDLYSNYADTVNAFMIAAAAVSLDKMAAIHKYQVYRKLAKERIKALQTQLDLMYPIDYRGLDKKAVAIYPFLKMKLVTPVYIISCLRRMSRKQ